MNAKPKRFAPGTYLYEGAIITSDGVNSWQLWIPTKDPLDPEWWTRWNEEESDDVADSTEAIGARYVGIYSRLKRAVALWDRLRVGPKSAIRKIIVEWNPEESNLKYKPNTGRQI